MVSKKQRLANLRATAQKHSIPNRIIDAITISFGLQNIAPDSLRSGGSIFERIKMFVNEIGGRTTGLNLFPDTTQFHQQFSIEGALTNQQTVAGIIAMIYSEAGKRFKILPLKTEARRFAKKNIAVGIGTGLFNENAQRFGFGKLTGGTQSAPQPISIGRVGAAN